VVVLRSSPAVVAIGGESTAALLIGNTEVLAEPARISESVSHQAATTTAIFVSKRKQVWKLHYQGTMPGLGLIA
jgi:hypothetical protein